MARPRKYGGSYKRRVARAGKVSRDRGSAIILKLKAVPCKDCGQTFSSCCMDFHHRDHKKKSFNIGAAVDAREERLKEEIAKCDVICANCHRIRTWITEKRKRPIVKGLTIFD